MPRSGTAGGIAVLAASLLLLTAPGASGAVIKVTTTTDKFAAGGGCSLREAIYSANKDVAYGDCTGGSGADEVRLTNGSVYALSLSGGNEDGNATGDLDIDSEMAIGPKKGKATIDAVGIDRVLDVLEGADLKLSRTTVTGGFGQYPPDALAGAGIRVSGARLETSKVKINDNRTLGNSANNGGGLQLQEGSVVKIDRTTIKRNEAGNVGGGVSMYDGTLKVSRSTIADNESDWVGAGLYLGGNPGVPSAVSIKDSTISGNAGGNNGGGLYLALYDQEEDEYAELKNVTVSGNFAAGYGGGIFGYVGKASLNGVTVTDNTADADATGGEYGGGLGGGGTSYLNSIIYGNHSGNPADPAPDCGGTSSSQGHNVTGADCFKATKDTHKDPKLKPLKDNGGPTQTHAIKGSGSAIGRADRGGAPKEDQRGFKRDKRPDSGAYERIKGK